MTNGDISAEVPLFKDKPGPYTVVFLLSEYPLHYAPAVVAEMRLLRDQGLDLQVLPVSRDPKADARGRNRPGLFRSRASFRRHSGSLPQLLQAHLRVMASPSISYRKGLRVLITFMGAPAQSPLARLHWIRHFVRAVAIGERLQRAGARRCHAHFTTNLAVFIAEIFPIDVSITLHGPRDFSSVPTSVLRHKISTSTFTRVISLDGLARVSAVRDRIDRGRVTFVPLGVDTRRFTSTSSQGGRRVVRLVCVARLEPVKGHHVLIDAFARVVSSGRPAELVIAGHGTARARIERRIRRAGLSKYVKCVGGLGHNEVPHLLRESDIFVLASRAEGLPVALMEAMSCGLPCVATRVNGVPELVRDGKTGLLVPQDDADSLAMAMCHLIDRPSVRRSFGKHGRREIRMNYDASRNAARFAAILDGVRVPVFGAHSVEVSPAPQTWRISSHETQLPSLSAP